MGISGGCGADCWVFQSGECEEPTEGFINWNMSDEDILELYDNGYYEKEITMYFKENNKSDLLKNRD